MSKIIIFIICLFMASLLSCKNSAQSDYAPNPINENRQQTQPDLAPITISEELIEGNHLAICGPKDFQDPYWFELYDNGIATDYTKLVRWTSKIGKTGMILVIDNIEYNAIYDPDYEWYSLYH